MGLDFYELFSYTEANDPINILIIGEDLKIYNYEELVIITFSCCFFSSISGICVLYRRAKLGKIQGGLQRGTQDFTKGGCYNFFIFTQKMSTF